MRRELKLFLISLGISFLLLSSLFLFALYEVAHQRRGIFGFVVMGLLTYPVSVFYGFDGAQPPVAAWVAAGVFEVLMVAVLIWGL